MKRDDTNERKQAVEGGVLVEEREPESAREPETSRERPQSETEHRASEPAGGRGPARRDPPPPPAPERAEPRAEATERLLPEETSEELLLSAQQKERLRTRWEAIQASFVDQPRDAVAEADSLVRDLIGQLAELFERERANLEGSWGRGEEVSTESLRVALQRYRTFFERLLAT